ncbi:MAG: NADH-quinone oxidoreductase subunit NuoH [Alphaproteobacteria bacterium]|nr:NADH-quinone oxidoreductase subunit NuoH [Alphaproteobacteria bacterium]
MTTFSELLGTYGADLFWLVIKIGALVLGLLIFVAYLTYAERKILAMMQLRQGPMTVGPFGLLQPFADAFKLISKETVFPTQVNRPVFIMAPILLMSLALVAWAVIPLQAKWVIADINVGVLYLFAVSSLGVYGVIMAGWASNSKYAFLGGMRSASQMVSYEVSMGLVIVTVILCTGSMNLSEIVTADRPWWMVALLFPMLVVFLVSILAETNRTPFDLPEGESELSGGFMVEYSSMTFALFFLGEYANMILMSGMTAILFLGGWKSPLGIEALDVVPGIFWFIAKVSLVLFFFIWARGTFPRYRYDQLMRLGWKVFLPFSLIWVVVVSGVLIYFNALPRL